MDGTEHHTEPADLADIPFDVDLESECSDDAFEDESCWERLPEPAIICVLSQVSSQRQRIRCCLVCKRWRDLYGEVPPNPFLLSASNDCRLIAWDARTWEQMYTLEGHERWITACDATPAGQVGASGSDDGMVHLWDLKRGRELCRFRAQVTVRCLAMHLKFLVTGGRDGLRFWRLPEELRGALPPTACAEWEGRMPEPRAHLRGHTAPVLCCAVTPSGSLVVSGAEDALLKVWDVGSAVCVATLTGHGKPVTCCAVLSLGLERGPRGALSLARSASPGGSRPSARQGPQLDVVVSGSADRDVKVWKLPIPSRVRPHPQPQSSASSPRRSLSIQVPVWSPGRVASPLAGSPSSPVSLASLQHSPSSPLSPLAAAAQGRPGSSSSSPVAAPASASSRAPPQHEQIAPHSTTRAHSLGVLCCQLSADGTQLLTGSHEPTEKMWRVDVQFPPHMHVDDPSLMSALALSLVLEDLAPSNRRRAAGGASNAPADGPHEKAVSCCAFATASSLFVTGSWDHRIKVWESENGRRCIRTLDKHSPGTEGCTCRWYDLWRPGACTLPGHSSSVNCVKLVAPSRSVGIAASPLSGSRRVPTPSSGPPSVRLFATQASVNT